MLNVIRSAGCRSPRRGRRGNLVVRVAVALLVGAVGLAAVVRRSSRSRRSWYSRYSPSSGSSTSSSNHMKWRDNDIRLYRGGGMIMGGNPRTYSQVDGFCCLRK